MPTAVGCLGEVQPRRGILVLEQKAMIKDLLLSKEEEQENPLLGVARMTRSQLADKARQLQIPVSENHTRGLLTKIFREDLDAAVKHQGLGLPGFRQAQSQDMSRSTEDGSRILSLDPSGGGSAASLETEEILIVAEDAERIPGTELGKQYDSRTYDKTHQTTRGGEDIRGNAGIERTRQTTQDARAESSQLNRSIGGGKPCR